MIIPGLEILNIQSVVNTADYVAAEVCIVIGVILLIILLVLEKDGIVDIGAYIAMFSTIVILFFGAFYGFHHAPRFEIKARIKDTDTFMEVYKYYKIINIDGDIFTLTERL